MSSLSSYRSSATLISTGTEAGKQVQETVTVSVEYTSNPSAEHLSVKDTSTGQATGTTFEMYDVGGKTYLNIGGKWTIAPASGVSSRLNIISGQKLLDNTCGWTQAGTVDVEGIKTVDYKTSQDALASCPNMKGLFGQGTVTQTSGDVYIAVDGNYLVKMDLSVQGTNLDVLGRTSGNATLDKGTEEIHYLLSDVNKSFTIEAPKVTG